MTMAFRVNSLTPRSNRGSARSDAMPNQSFAISRKTFENLEQWIEDNRFSAAKGVYGLQLLTRLCILVVKAEAQRRSFGPVAARHRSNPALAYKIPVQRITGHYFAGWMVRKTPRGWMIYNDEIEAYLIETGMFMRVRRPVLKMSVIGMLRFIQTTRTAERFVDWMFLPRRDPRGRFQSFNARVAPTVSVMAGPQGKLPL